MTVEFPAVPLHRYAERIGYAEPAFFGINHPDNPKYACREVWTEWQRQLVAWSLLEAQEEIETELRYTLTPRWQVAERHPATCPVRSRWGRVIAAGVMTDTMVQAAAPVDYAADPAVILVNVGAHDPADLHVFLHGTDIEVWPTSIHPSGPGAVIRIPWARLVGHKHRDNPPEGWLYHDVATWGAEAVDVRAIANDPSDQARLVSATNCPACGHKYAPACVRIERADIGSLTWARTGGCACGASQWIDLNYLAGMTMLTRQAEDTVIRLAHAKMPEEPCGCEGVQRLWRRDRNTPEVLTRERVNCPFGMADGAWVAWRFAQTMKLVRGSVL